MAPLTETTVSTEAPQYSPKKGFHPVPEAASAPHGTGADPRRTGELRTAPREETAPPPEPRDAERAAGRRLPRGMGNGRTRRYPRAHYTLPTSRPRLATPPSQTEARPLRPEVTYAEGAGRPGVCAESWFCPLERLLTAACAAASAPCCAA